MNYLRRPGPSGHHFHILTVFAALFFCGAAKIFSAGEAPAAPRPDWQDETRLHEGTEPAFATMAVLAGGEDVVALAKQRVE